ncbi:anti-anti-sigma factor [Saccharomonospora piscinae]|uniref:Anti-sigma factor antagonist n=1 Tax=Saccharomonospora piscinae TaxID=687388 RepID=A0A1V9A622_SACPI|nr:STAS domain-containing protein [Saccharomonospora piscinae]OQO92490.1 anti-anti-sigma factor [Saccharomonospora piscinae]TLW91805.1 STAS domain-containing protein [Saccharomonospora piscinae]
MTDREAPSAGDGPAARAEAAQSTVHVELADSEGRVTLTGEIDHGVAPQLDDALTRLLAQDVDRLVVDFARLSFFDSACISALVRAHARMAERDGTITLVNVDEYAYRVLQISGLLPLFDVRKAP